MKGLINRVYFIISDQLIKIGYSKNPRKRLGQLKTGSGQRLWLCGYIEGNLDTERQLHKRFENYKSFGEWYFPNKELIEFINNVNLLNYTLEYSNKLIIYKKMKNI